MMKSKNLYLGFQIAWAILCVAWNLYGTWLTATNQQAFAPTSSIAIAVLSMVFVGLFLFFHAQKIKIPYLFISALTAVLAAYAVYGGFVQEKALWSSETWRWLGILLNGMGALAGIFAFFSALKWS